LTIIWTIAAKRKQAKMWNKKIDFDLFVARLEIAKSKLTPRQREIFELSKEQNLSVSEVAERLSIGEQPIYNQLSVALQLLRKEIGSVFLLMFALFFENVI
jgi:RNA polymerase sigma-70 factor (ECF subfamily)